VVDVVEVAEHDGQDEDRSKGEVRENHMVNITLDIFLSLGEKRALRVFFGFMSMVYVEDFLAHASSCSTSSGLITQLLDYCIRRRGSRSPLPP
jgi:hypothetical protein